MNGCVGGAIKSQECVMKNVDAHGGKERREGEAKLTRPTLAS